MNGTMRFDGGSPRGILSPAADIFCVGGASLAAVAIILLLPASTAGPILLQRVAVLSMLLNWPHFMASYDMLYRTPGAIGKHPFATLYVPAFLILYAAGAAALYGREPLFFYAFHAAAAVYLAWHYTGQAWGMAAAFAHVEGLRFADDARRLVRANLRVLLAWHALWALHTVAAKLYFTSFAWAYEAVSLLAAASPALGALGLWRLRRLAGRLPARVVLPWLSIHAWYLLLYRYPGALFWVQISHAAQYLIFPIRVSANRQSRLEHAPPSLAGGARYYALLAASGFGAFWLAPRLAGAAAAWAASAVPAGVLLVDLLNIHHYFVDGCIWKLKNPEVRRDLFMHLAPGAGAAGPS